jgi:hypothetical protein
VPLVLLIFESVGANDGCPLIHALKESFVDQDIYDVALKRRRAWILKPCMQQRNS